MKNSVAKKIIQIFLICGVLAVVCLGFLKDRNYFSLDEPNLPTPSFTHDVDENNKPLNLLWTRSDIFLEQDNIGLFVEASQGVLTILGNLNNHENVSLFAFDAENGDILWAGGTGKESTLRTDAAVLYVGDGGSGRVTTYNLHSGKNIWSEPLPNTRSVRRIYVTDDLLQINASFENFFLINARTGNLIKRSKHELDQDIFLITDQVMFIQQPTTSILQAISMISNSLIWDVDVEKAFHQGPVFTDDIIFIRTERGLGSIFAIGRHTGNILWKTERNVISNVVAKETTVYYLTWDGKLIGLDARTGEQESSITFKPNPFILNGPNNPVVGGYHVAVDEEEGVLYAVLGDSKQLFAFEIVE